jgi:hypothetical protein
MLAAGPPFDPAQPGLSGHSAYLGDDRVYRVFGGEASRKKALNLAREHMVEVSRWQSIIDGLPSSVADVPSDARCLYRWTPEASSEA